MASTLERLTYPHFPNKPYQKRSKSCSNLRLAFMRHNPSDAGPSKDSQVLLRAFTGTERTLHLHPGQPASHNTATAVQPLCPLCHSEIPPELCIALLLRKLT